MENKRAATLLYGPEEHHLDHLAAISLVMHIPLFVTEQELETLAKTYYPRLEIIYLHYAEIADTLTENYEVIFSALPKILIEEIFFLSQHKIGKRLHSVWCPHGNSDKGHKTPFMEGLKKEEIALVYGDKMLDFLKTKGAFDQLKALIYIGNFRYSLYKEEKPFYQGLIKQQFSSIEDQKKILYAPTWEDSEQSSSFFSAVEILVNTLPEDYSLIIKLHPHLLQNHKTEPLMLRYENKERVYFLSHFPPVYPLLDFCDIYIGDMSSVGYDFLSFDKPMFFLNESGRDTKSDPGLYLYRCGVEVPPSRYNDIYKLIHYHITSDKEDFSAMRKEVYHYTFGPEKERDLLRREILDSFRHLPEPELDFL